MKCRFAASSVTVAALATIAGVTACSHPDIYGGGTAGSSGSCAPLAGTGGRGPAVAVACGPGTPAGRDMTVTPAPDGGVAPAKMSCNDTTFAWNDCLSPGYPTLSAADKSDLDNWVSSMSLSEKADQMRGTPRDQYQDFFRTPDNTNRGIRGFLFRDGPRGLNLDAPLATGATGGRATAFPVPMARGASFDLDLEYRIGVAIGDETVAAGQTMMLSPTINILRHPYWGRAQETYGEDPFQLGRFGSANVVGIQQFVPACVKHYAANNIENGRNAANAVMDEQTLHEIYARHFEMTITDAGTACVMASYNPVNGTKATQNRHLLTDLLRTEFRFPGLILSDWWAMPGWVDALSVDRLQTYAGEAVSAGLDMELPWSKNYAQIESLAGAGGSVSTEAVNTSVRRILEQKLRFKVARTSAPIGLKAATTTYAGGSITNNDAHLLLAEEAALKSIVLLKNQGDVLPIKSTARTIAVIGAALDFQSYLGPSRIDFATNRITGALNTLLTGDWGSSRVQVDLAKSVGPLAGMMEAAGAGINVITGSTAAAAQSADFVVVIAGLTTQDEGEEYTMAGDRDTLALDGKTNRGVQDNLIMQVAGMGKPMAVVLEGGGPISMPWLSQVPAVVMAWYPGQQGGRALGKLLFGRENFSGKLPITWPANDTDFPPFSGGANTTMDYDVGYRYFDRKNTTALFPFGHGLSYTDFRYSNLQIPCSDITKNGVVEVQVDVTNAGAVKGDEVVLLFASYPNSTKRRPIKELKGFYRVSLEPGATKRVTIPVRISDLKHYDTACGRWEVESGAVRLMVGSSSIDLPLMDTVMVR